jgi:hypothetical protein
MRETSHEIGRTQLFYFLRLITELPTDTTEITEIGNVYKTAMRTRATLRGLPKSEIFYDGVLGIKYRRGAEVTCYIESKVANTPFSIRKLPKYLEISVLNAYGALTAWNDDLGSHKPIFLFLTNTPFSSSLIQNGKLVKQKVRSALGHEFDYLNEPLLTLLLDSFHIFFFCDWLQGLMR